MRHRTLVIALAATLLAGLAVAAPASAAASQPVQIDLHVDFATGETFTAEGPFCPSGTAESYNFRGPDRAPGPPPSTYGRTSSVTTARAS